jgi:IclR family mhp operon transcriptional activator
MARALSAGFHEQPWITQIAKPYLFELGDSIVWPVNIATLAASNLIVREATDHHSPLAIEHFSAGMPLSLLTTSAGRAYLAHCPDAERNALLHALSRSTNEDEQLACDSPQLRCLLAEVGRLGYAATTCSQHLVEEVSLSVPVSLHPGKLAVLTVRFSASAVPLKVGLDRFLPKLRHCAAKIGAAFRKTGEVREGIPRTTA